MGNVKIIDNIHDEWRKFFEQKNREDPLAYPTIQILTAKTLKDKMRQEGHFLASERMR
jgi:hypothetical protein